MTKKQLLDLIEAALGKRPLVLTTGEFAALTGRDRKEVWQDCLAGNIKATQHGGLKGRWRIPVTELAPYLEG